MSDGRTGTSPRRPPSDRGTYVYCDGERVRVIASKYSRETVDRVYRGFVTTTGVTVCSRCRKRVRIAW